MSFVIVEGNATADATLREFTNKRTGNVVPISNATIAVNDRRYDPDTEQWEDTGRAFYEVTVTGSEAAHFAATAVKGARLLIAGELYTEEYRDPDGNPRTRRRITARNHGLSTRYAPALAAAAVGS